jgi:hypothetical protein
MAHDVFISYATQDKPTADAVCARLEQQGIRCWIAPRDILPGRDWRTSIVEGIGNARALVLMLSAHANSSSEIPKEILQATQRSLPIITFRIEDVTPSGSLSYELNSIHWLDALTKPLERHIDTLAATLKRVLNVETSPAPPTPVVPPAPNRSTATLIAAVAGAIIVTLGISWWILRPPAAEPPPQVLNSPVGVPKPEPSTQPSSSPAAVAPTQPRREATPPVATATASPPPPRPASTNPLLSPPAPVSNQNEQPVVGCWQQAGMPGILVVKSNGTFVSGGVVNGSWTTLNTAPSTYRFQFPDDVTYGELSSDDRRLVNPAIPNEPFSRVSGGPGIAGVWRSLSGIVLSIESNGNAQVGSLTGRWKVADPARRLYETRWPVQPTITIVGGAMKYVDASRGIAVDLTRLPC